MFCNLSVMPHVGRRMKKESEGNDSWQEGTEWYQSLTHSIVAGGG